MWPVSLIEIPSDDSLSLSLSLSLSHTHTHTHTILIYNTTNLDFYKDPGQAEQFWEFLFGKYQRRR